MSLSKFELRLKEDPAFLARFIVNPREALSSSDVQLENAADVKRLETFARQAQSQLRLAADLAGFAASAEAEWGIGMGCCNSKSLSLIDADAVKRLERQEADLSKRILPKSE